MIYNITKDLEAELLALPETGMGYQIIEAQENKTYSPKRFLILNSEIAIDFDGRQGEFVRKIMNEGIYLTKLRAPNITLSVKRVLKENEVKTTVNEIKSEKERGALDNDPEPADGNEQFIRLSAFLDDKRIDKENKCLRPGSFTTTLVDYIECLKINDNPAERYALPGEEKIEWAFYIKPKKGDVLQRGKVQQAFGRRGGGKEAYFEKGTSKDTYKEPPLPYGQFN